MKRFLTILFLFSVAYGQRKVVVSTGSNGGIIAGVSSYNGRAGAVVPLIGDYTVSQITGAAPLASPTFTGTVTLNNLKITGLSQGVAHLDASSNLTSGAVDLTGSEVTGTLPIANGGTGSTTATGAINNLLPSQTGKTNYYLKTDGLNVSWSAVSSGGLSSINGLTSSTQTFATGTSGTDFNIVSSGSVHTFNIPNATSTNRGFISSTDWNTFNNKLSTSRQITINGTTYDLSADRTWTVGDVTQTGSQTLSNKTLTEPMINGLYWNFTPGSDADYTLASTDVDVTLPELASANRTLTLPSPTGSKRIVFIRVKNSSATYSWLSSQNIYKSDGTTFTTFPNQHNFIIVDNPATTHWEVRIDYAINNLVNDLASPGNNKGYITDASGVKGWNDIPYINHTDGRVYYNKNGTPMNIPDSTDFLKINITSVHDHDVIAYDSASLTWQNMAGAWESSRQRLLRQLGSSIVAETFPSYETNTSSTISPGTQYYYLFSLDKTTTLRGYEFVVYTAGSFTASNDNRIALYKLSNDTLNLVASSATNGAIWQSSGVQNIDFSSDYQALPGVYAISFIYNNSAETTRPALVVRSSASTTNINILDMPNSISLVGTVTGVSTIPSSIKFSSITPASYGYWFGVRRR